jgi:formylmethanofuran dehydrogenase subunit E
MCKELTLWEKCVEFHGYLCPERAIGYRVSKIAIAQLGITRENSLQFIAGATNLTSAE